MAKVLDEVLEVFYSKLSESDAVSKETIKELRTLFESERKLKAADFVAVLDKAVQEGSRDSD